MSEDNKDKTPVVRISIASAVGQTRQMSFETYVDVLTPKDVIDGIADKLMSVVDRQIAYYEIIDLEKLLKAQTDQLEAMKEDLIRVDAAHNKMRTENSGRVPFKLSAKDQADRNNITVNIQHRVKQLETLKRDIEERKAKVGVRNV